MFKSLLLEHIHSTPSDDCFYEDDQGQFSHSLLMQEAKRISKHIYMDIKHSSCLSSSPEFPVVGIYGHASIDVVRCVLAVLHSSAAFLLLDPNLPSIRLWDIVKESSACLVINTTNMLQMAARGAPMSDAIRIVTLAELQQQQEITDQDLPSRSEIHSSTLPFSHLTFTSGSTGRPLAVMGSEEGLINRSQWMKEAGLISKTSIVAIKTSVTFVDSITELLLPLLIPCSASCLDPALVLRPRFLFKALQRHKITHYTSTPSLLNLWTEDFASLNLKVLVSSGELLPWSLALKLKKLLPAGCKILNIYGSAEVSADCSAFDIPLQDKDLIGRSGFVPAGKPLTNCHLMIRLPLMSGNENEVSPSASCESKEEGEVLVSGLCLSHGYLSNQSMNLKRFITLEEQRGSSCRYYASGDLGFIDSDGNLNIRGRMDNTIKVNGARVSIEEVESCLSAAPGVEQVACSAILIEGSSHKLVAFYQAKSHMSSSDLRRWASEHLPSHAIPSQFILVAQPLPLTLGGKVDRTKLPQLPLAISAPSQIVSINATHSEASLSRLIVNLLAVPLEPNDNFFEVGGMSSLQAVEVAARLRTEPTLIYSAPTIRRLAAVLSKVVVNTQEPDGHQSKKQRTTEEEVIRLQPKPIVSQSRSSSSRAASWLRSTQELWALSAGSSSFSSLPPLTSGDCDEDARYKLSQSISVLFSAHLGRCVDAPPLLVSSHSSDCSVVIASSHSGVVLCLDAKTGEEMMWRAEMSSRADVGCCLCAGEASDIPLIAVVVGDASVVFLSLISGTQVGCSPPIAGGIRAPPRVLGHHIWLTTHGPSLICLSIPSPESSSSAIIFQVTLPAPSSCPPLFTMGEENEDHLALVACLDGSIHTYSIQNGPSNKLSISIRERWIMRSTTGPIFSTPIVVNKDTNTVLVTAHVAGHLVGRSIKMGKELWTQDLKGQIFADLASCTSGSCDIIAATHSGHVFGLDCSDGSIRWKIDLSAHGQISNTPSVNRDGQVLIASNSGVLVVIDLGGKMVVGIKPRIVALASLPSDCFCSPIFHNHDIWIGCRDDNLYKLLLK